METERRSSEPRGSEALPETQSLRRFFGGSRSSVQAEIQLQQRAFATGTTATGTTVRGKSEVSLPLHARVSEVSEIESELRWYDVAGSDEAVYTASLTPSCFSLVLVCALRGVSIWMPMMLITPIGVLQFSVLYIICFASPQYLFASGVWLLPNSASKSLSVMKSFATVLMLGQIAEEFHEISESMKVLRQSRLSITRGRRLLGCWLCISIQYIQALMVMVTSGQVILGRQNPIEPLWMTYYVFMTLSFDNMLVKFIMYVRTMERHTIWKVEISHPETPTSRTRSQRLDFAQRLAVLWVPLVLAASVSILCRVFNVLPITLLRYGPVSNEKPVVMFSSLSLPAGCCPSVASINNSYADTVSVSVPCLSPEAPEDWPNRPLVYWVASPSHKAMPTSLQIREGRTSDGSKALLAGHVEAKPLELWPWMSRHGYEAQDIDTVLGKLNDETLGIGLYHRTFAYVAEIQVHPFPWFEEVAIYAIARNRVTGALSPKPAVSNVLHGKRCPPHCEICDRQGQCRRCQEGFRKDKDSTCHPCPEGCLRCPHGTSQCTKCKAKFGLVPYASKQICVPCSSDNCQSCDGPVQGAIPPSALPCHTCDPFYGLDLHGHCQRCEDENCLHCEGGSGCTACASGFVLAFPCAFDRKRAGWKATALALGETHGLALRIARAGGLQAYGERPVQGLACRPVAPTAEPVMPMTTASLVVAFRALDGRRGTGASSFGPNAKRAACSIASAAITMHTSAPSAVRTSASRPAGVAFAVA
ncbi:Histone deacetylase 6 [Durusdinium trenchii]|uniref:Histone deacetylase 6 n=1 Tax=Durusdinium trenchii TaxID=1381693 RepID=A0ABP0RUH3_9DINO